MNIQAIAFDVNGTLIDILTDEGLDEIYRAIGHVLTYQGVDLRRFEVRELYFSILKEQQQSSGEEFPEFDAVAIFQRIIDKHGTAYTRALPAEKLAHLPEFLAEMYRGISRRKLKLYPFVREVLDVLKTRYKLALVTDAQSAYARAELNKVGLLDYFNPIIVSGNYGYRKPDKRLFQAALDTMGVAPANTIYIGNDMYRDVFGAREAGMRTVMFDSAQGTKTHRDCTADYTITDYRDLLSILSLPPLG